MSLQKEYCWPCHASLHTDRIFFCNHTTWFISTNNAGMLSSQESEMPHFPLLNFVIDGKLMLSVDSWFTHEQAWKERVATNQKHNDQCSGHPLNVYSYKSMYIYIYIYIYIYMYIYANWHASVYWCTYHWFTHLCTYHSMHHWITACVYLQGFAGCLGSAVDPAVHPQ